MSQFIVIFPNYRTIIVNFFDINHNKTMANIQEQPKIELKELRVGPEEILKGP